MATIIDKINELYDRATAKIPIQVNKTTITMNRGNGWTENIVVSNASELRNLRANSVGTEPINLTWNGGTLNISTPNNYQNNWTPRSSNVNPVVEITADNAVADIRLPYSSSTQGRIGVAAVSYRFGAYDTEIEGIRIDWVCGSVGVRSQSSSMTGKTINNTTTGNTLQWDTTNNRLQHTTAAGSGAAAQNGNVYLIGSLNGRTHNSATIVVGARVNSSNICPVNPANFPNISELPIKPE